MIIFKIKKYKFRFCLENPCVDVGYSFFTGANVWVSKKFKGISFYILGYGISFEFGDWILI